MLVGPTVPRLAIAILISLTLALMSACGDGRGLGAEALRTKVGCDPDRVEAIDGRRRLALIVGVGEYQREVVPDLPGPPQDARRIYRLLTDPNGYGFPEANVCLLLDEQATTANFRQAFEQALISRARPGDVAVFYFAGHGSQTRDKNGDEPDAWDETLMLHDARTDVARDLLDDELNGLLARLHRKTSDITLILDSCNSGTATRAPAQSTVMARFMAPIDDEADPGLAAVEGLGDGASSLFPAALPGIATLTAASDSSSAVEKSGRGVFTDALLQVLSQVGDRPLTLAQVARQVPPLVAAESPQVPGFHGELDRPVFGNRMRTRPVAWEVIDAGPPVSLGGAPLPGIGVGAELRVYDGTATGRETQDPGLAKATLVVDAFTGINVSASLAVTGPKADPIERGDLAVLARPADAFVKLHVRLRPASEPGGLPEPRARALREAFQANNEAARLIELTDGAGDYEIRTDASGRLLVHGPEERVRNVLASDRDAPETLWQHARQRALLHLRGEGGADFADQETLLVRLVPAEPSRLDDCVRGVWEQAEPNREQRVPLCQAWNLEVRLSPQAPVPLLIGALILSTDGSTLALPGDGRKVRLRPGERVRFRAERETFQGRPPLDVQDRVLAFGTRENNPVQWTRYTQTAQARSAQPPRAGLEAALDRYLVPGARGRGFYQASPGPEIATWTLSQVTMRVEANPGFPGLDQDRAGPFDWESFAAERFDIRPYLPDDPSTGIHRLLVETHRLAKASRENGYSYASHPWRESEIEQNLRLGVDSARAVWLVFSRAGLSYNGDDRHIPTKDMAGRDSPMREEFESCLNDNRLRPGDLLVDRDAHQGDGQVLLVIDPERGMGWGSHGLDGTAAPLPAEPHSAVQYQKIKHRPDWARFGRDGMRRAACWRHRTLIAEYEAGLGMPGSAALLEACQPNALCGWPRP